MTLKRRLNTCDEDGDRVIDVSSSKTDLAFGVVFFTFLVKKVFPEQKTIKMYQSITK